MESVLEVLRCLRLKFGQNRVSNSWDIWWGVLLLVLLVLLVVVVTGVKQSQLQVLRLKTEVWQYWALGCSRKIKFRKTPFYQLGNHVSIWNKAKSKISEFYLKKWPIAAHFSKWFIWQSKANEILPKKYPSRIFIFFLLLILEAF